MRIPEAYRAPQPCAAAARPRAQTPHPPLLLTMLQSVMARAGVVQQQPIYSGPAAANSATVAFRDRPSKQGSAVSEVLQLALRGDGARARRPEEVIDEGVGEFRGTEQRLEVSLGRAREVGVVGKEPSGEAVRGGGSVLAELAREDVPCLAVEGREEVGVSAPEGRGVVGLRRSVVPMHRLVQDYVSCAGEDGAEGGFVLHVEEV